MAVTMSCARRPFEYSAEGAQPLAHRQMATTRSQLVAHNLPSQRFDPSPPHFTGERHSTGPTPCSAVPLMRIYMRIMPAGSRACDFPSESAGLAMPFRRAVTACADACAGFTPCRTEQCHGICNFTAMNFFAKGGIQANRTGEGGL